MERYDVLLQLVARGHDAKDNRGTIIRVPDNAS